MKSEQHVNNFTKSKASVPLTEACLAEFDRTSQYKPRAQSNSRPMSAITHTTAMASHMSILPTLSSHQVAGVAKMIFDSRSTVIQLTRQPNSKVNLRDTISSTQIYSILKKNGVFVDLGHIKVLLRELGLPYNGPSTSFTMLFNACKAFLHGNQPNVQVNGNLRSDITQSEFSGLQRTRAHESRQPQG